MRLLIVALGGCLVATSATAQRVECFSTNAQTICETRPDPNQMNRDAMARMERERLAREQSLQTAPTSGLACARGDWLLQGCTYGQHRDAKEAAELRKQAGQLIAAGRCPEAFRLALDRGDIALAREVRGLCS